MYTIRNYKDGDYEMLTAWWREAREPAPKKSLVPEDTTYILEIMNIPALSICLFTTNVKGMCYLENFIGNPNLKESRKYYSQVIVDYAIDKAKELGYETVVCLSYKDKVGKHYEKLGMTKTLTGMTGFAKEIK